MCTGGRRKFPCTVPLAQPGTELLGDRLRALQVGVQSHHPRKNWELHSGCPKLNLLTGRVGPKSIPKLSG